MPISSQLRRIDWIAVTALITSICALAASIWDGFSTRTHNRVSVRPIPYITFTSSSLEDHDKWTGWRLSNFGLGTGIVRYVRVYLRQDPLKHPRLYTFSGESNNKVWKETYVYLSGEKKFEGGRATAQWVGQGAPIKPNDSVALYTVEPGPLSTLMVSTRNQIFIRACMCSVYEECFEVDTRRDRLAECVDDPATDGEKPATNSPFRIF
jgi:hypothetical protein